MGAIKNYYHDEICGREGDILNQQDDYPTEEEHDGQPNEQQENEDFAQDGEMENREAGDIL